MRIDPTVEEPTRELFGFAIRSELAEFDEKLRSFGDDITLREALLLAMAVSAMVLNDSAGGHAPTRERLRDTAAILAEIQDDYTLEQDEVYDYLDRCVYGGVPLTTVLPEGAAVTLPFVVAGNLLGSHAEIEKGQQWWDYLDAIEEELEAAPETAEVSDMMRGLRADLRAADRSADRSAERDTPSG
jgi:hypothetical protein